MHFLESIKKYIIGACKKEKENIKRKPIFETIIQGNIPNRKPE